MGESGTRSVAEALLHRLHSQGIEHLYVNAGTDFAPFVEAYNRLGPESRRCFPQPVIATHENLAVGMAHGAYLATGRPQAVMVHVSVGTANGLSALMDAARGRAPILFMAGRTPIYESGVLGARDLPIHWGQELFDQGSLVREVVKWDYELRGGHHLDDVIDRALTISMAEPRGPVYLTLPREVLADSMPSGAPRPRPETRVAPMYPDPEAVAQLAQRLSQAQMPVVVSGSLNFDTASVALVGDICEEFALGVIGSTACVSVRQDHPFHLGFRVDEVLHEADVLCVVESDVPWIPDRKEPLSSTFVAQCGVDPLFSRYPMRSHRSDLNIQSAIVPLIRDLAEALRQCETAGLRERRARLLERAATIRQAATETRARDADGGQGITKVFLNACLSDVYTPDCVIVNEYWANLEHLGNVSPGSFFNDPAAGGLGWGLPAALGMRQAMEEKIVIATVGDGSYLFANPAACHLAAAMFDLPILTIVCNNGRWDAVESSTRAVYPDGTRATSGTPSLSSLTPRPAYERLIEASGGYGERVEKRDHLREAIQRGLDVVRSEGRQALLNVLCE